jgi:hypothetical protein
MPSEEIEVVHKMKADKRVSRLVFLMEGFTADLQVDSFRVCFTFAVVSIASLSTISFPLLTGDDDDDDDDAHGNVR